MKVVKKGEKQSSSRLHQNIRKAAFVPLGTEKREINKYFELHIISVTLNKLLTKLRTYFNRIKGRAILWVSGRDLHGMWLAAIYWLANAIIEGSIANFVTHYLLGWVFNPLTILAHGFAINQGISIYWRLKKDGSNSTISTKNK